jgi:hypothetical protein
MSYIAGLHVTIPGLHGTISGLHVTIPGLHITIYFIIQKLIDSQTTRIISFVA